MTFPPLPQPKLVLDLATPEVCKAELTWSAGCIPRWYVFAFSILRIAVYVFVFPCTVFLYLDAYLSYFKRRLLNSGLLNKDNEKQRHDFTSSHYRTLKRFTVRPILSCRLLFHCQIIRKSTKLVVQYKRLHIDFSWKEIILLVKINHLLATYVGYWLTSLSYVL